MLVGTWDDANDADREAVARVAGSSYVEVERALRRSANEPDPPLPRLPLRFGAELIAAVRTPYALVARLLVSHRNTLLSHAAPRASLTVPN